MVKYVKNAVVNMPWEVENFYESKVNGFVAAVHNYEIDGVTVGVAFQDGCAYVMPDDNGGYKVGKALERDIVVSGKEGYSLMDYFGEDGCYLIAVAGGLVDSGECLGLSEDDVTDIINRINDLSGYYQIEEQVASI